MASKKFNMFNLLNDANNVKDTNDTNEKKKNEKKEKKTHIPWSNPTGYISWADADDEPPLDFTQPLNIKF